MKRNKDTIITITTTTAAVTAALLATPTLSAPNWKQWTQQGDRFEARFESLDRAARVLVAAPHAQFDLRTGPLARAIIDELGVQLPADGLVAYAHQDSGVRLNVNRPTEGVHLSCAEETRSPAAQKVYDAYLAEVVARAPRLDWYFEVHGSALTASKGFSARMEVGARGLSASDAARVRATLRQAMPEVEVLVEGIDELRLTGECTRRIGAMSQLKPETRALHLEMSPELRAPEALARTSQRLAAALAAISAKP